MERYFRVKRKGNAARYFASAKVLNATAIRRDICPQKKIGENKIKIPFFHSFALLCPVL